MKKECMVNIEVTGMLCVAKDLGVENTRGIKVREGLAVSKYFN